MAQARRYGRRCSAVRRGRPPAAAGGPTPYALQRRADTVGVRHAADPRAGSMLGCYLLRGLVSERQYQAGETLARFWLRWRHLALVRDPGLRRYGAAAPVSDDDRAKAWSKIKRRMEMINPVIRGHLDVVDLVIYGQWVEPSPVFLARLRDDLDKIGVIFAQRVLPAA